LGVGCAALVVALASWAAAAQDLGTIKVGVLEFGTVKTASSTTTFGCRASAATARC
jgi:hypothetical protein